MRKALLLGLQDERPNPNRWINLSNEMLRDITKLEKDTKKLDFSNFEDDIKNLIDKTNDLFLLAGIDTTMSPMLESEELCSLQRDFIRNTIKLVVATRVLSTNWDAAPIHESAVLMCKEVRVSLRNLVRNRKIVERDVRLMGKYTGSAVPTVPMTPGMNNELGASAGTSGDSHEHEQIHLPHDGDDALLTDQPSADDGFKNLKVAGSPKLAKSPDHEHREDTLVPDDAPAHKDEIPDVVVSKADDSSNKSSKQATPANHSPTSKASEPSDLKGESFASNTSLDSATKGGGSSFASSDDETLSKRSSSVNSLSDDGSSDEGETVDGMSVITKSFSNSSVPSSVTSHSSATRSRATDFPSPQSSIQEESKEEVAKPNVARLSTVTIQPEVGKLAGGVSPVPAPVATSGEPTPSEASPSMVAESVVSVETATSATSATSAGESGESSASSTRSGSPNPPAMSSMTRRRSVVLPPLEEAGLFPPMEMMDSPEAMDDGDSVNRRSPDSRRSYQTQVSTADKFHKAKKVPGNPNIKNRLPKRAGSSVRDLTTTTDDSEGENSEAYDAWTSKKDLSLRQLSLPVWKQGSSAESLGAGTTGSATSTRLTLFRKPNVVMDDSDDDDEVVIRKQIADAQAMREAQMNGQSVEPVVLSVKFPQICRKVMGSLIDSYSNQPVDYMEGLFMMALDAMVTQGEFIDIMEEMARALSTLFAILDAIGVFEAKQDSDTKEVSLKFDLMREFSLRRDTIYGDLNEFIKLTEDFAREDTPELRQDLTIIIIAIIKEYEELLLVAKCILNDKDFINHFAKNLDSIKVLVALDQNAAEVRQLQQSIKDLVALNQLRKEQEDEEANPERAAADLKHYIQNLESRLTKEKPISQFGIDESDLPKKLPPEPFNGLKLFMPESLPSTPSSPASVASSLARRPVSLYSMDGMSIRNESTIMSKIPSNEKSNAEEQLMGDPISPSMSTAAAPRRVVPSMAPPLAARIFMEGAANSPTYPVLDRERAKFIRRQMATIRRMPLKSTSSEGGDQPNIASPVSIASRDSSLARSVSQVSQKPSGEKGGEGYDEIMKPTKDYAGLKPAAKGSSNAQILSWVISPMGEDLGFAITDVTRNEENQSRRSQTSANLPSPIPEEAATLGGTTGLGYHAFGADNTSTTTIDRLFGDESDDDMDDDEMFSGSDWNDMTSVGKPSSQSSSPPNKYQDEEENEILSPISSAHSVNSLLISGKYPETSDDESISQDSGLIMDEDVKGIAKIMEDSEFVDEPEEMDESYNDIAKALEDSELADEIGELEMAEDDDFIVPPHLAELDEDSEELLQSTEDTSDYCPSPVVPNKRISVARLVDHDVVLTSVTELGFHLPLPPATTPPTSDFFSENNLGSSDPEDYSYNESCTDDFSTKRRSDNLIKSNRTSTNSRRRQSMLLSPADLPIQSEAEVEAKAEAEEESSLQEPVKPQDEEVASIEDAGGESIAEELEDPNRPRVSKLADPDEPPSQSDPSALAHAALASETDSNKKSLDKSTVPLRKSSEGHNHHVPEKPSVELPGRASSIGRRPSVPSEVANQLFNPKVSKLKKMIVLAKLHHGVRKAALTYIAPHGAEFQAGEPIPPNPHYANRGLQPERPARKVFRRGSNASSFSNQSNGSSEAVSKLASPNLSRKNSTTGVGSTPKDVSRTNSIGSATKKNSLETTSGQTPPTDLPRKDGVDQTNKPTVSSDGSLKPPQFNRKQSITSNGDESDFKDKRNKRQSICSARSDIGNRWYLCYSYSAEDIVFKEGIILSATIDALVERLTLHDEAIDSKLMETFLLTFRSFSKATEFLELLIARYMIKPPEGLAEDELAIWTSHKQTSIRIRVNNLLKTWLESYFYEADDGVCLQRLIEFCSGDMMDTMPSAAKRLVSMAGDIHDKLRAEASTSKVTRSKTMDLMMAAAIAKLPNHLPPLPVIPKGITKSLLAGLPFRIVDLDPLEVARQLTIMDIRNFSQIRPHELIGLEFSKNKSNSVLFVRVMTDATNEITSVICDCVLKEADPKRRAHLVTFFIRLGENLLLMKNFNSLMPIVGALNSSMISRLKKTWNLILPKFKDIFEHLRKSTDHSRNYADYRSVLRTSAPPCIPFLGIYLTDLTFTDEGNSAFKAGDDKQAKRHINFAKYYRTVAIVQEIQKFQVPYNLIEVKELQERLKLWMVTSNQQWDEDKFYERSLVLEPRPNSKPALTVRANKAPEAAAEPTSNKSAPPLIAQAYF